MDVYKNINFVCLAAPVHLDDCHGAINTPKRCYSDLHGTESQRVYAHAHAHARLYVDVDTALLPPQCHGHLHRVHHNRAGRISRLNLAKQDPPAGILMGSF